MYAYPPNLGFRAHVHLLLCIDESHWTHISNSASSAAKTHKYKRTFESIIEHELSQQTSLGFRLGAGMEGARGNK